MSGDDLLLVENVLADTEVPRHTRRSILQRAAIGVAAAGAFGAAPAALAARREVSPESTTTILNTAITAEIFAVLFLDQVIARAGSSPSSKAPLIDILKAAGAAEYDHYAALNSLGAKPLAGQVWIPDALYSDGGRGLFANIELAETLFVNAYLVAVTSFANAGGDTNSSYARYAAEILGTEGEHRVLARFAMNTIGPNTGHVANYKGFETFTYSTLGDIVKQLQGVGIGFGTQGATPGAFYTFDGKKPSSFSVILADMPDSTYPVTLP